MHTSHTHNNNKTTKPLKCLANQASFSGSKGGQTRGTSSLLADSHLLVVCVGLQGEAEGSEESVSCLVQACERGKEEAKAAG